MFGQINEIKDLALKYSKPQLGRMAQLGMIEPQKAMMAGMMRDRIAKEDAKPPTSTVAQDVLGLQPPQQQQAQPQQMGMPQGQPQGMPQQAPQPQMGMPPQPEQPPMDATQMAATGGLTSLPVPEQDYAGGGIVAFDEGGEVPGYARGGFPTMPNMDIQLQEYSARPVGDDYVQKDLAEKQKIYEQQGIVNPYEGFIKQNEDKRAEIGTRKEQAKGEFLMNLGVGLMGAKQGREFEALGAGAKEGLTSYKESMKDVRASEERLDDRKSAYELANYQAKKLGTDASIAKKDAALVKLDEAANKNIEANNALAVKGKEFEMQAFGKKVDYFSADNAARVSGSNQIALEKERQKAMPDLYKMANAPDMIKAMPNSTLAQRMEAVGRYAHPKDSYNALTSRFNLLNKTISETNYPLSIAYNSAKTDAERKEILDKMNANATRIRTEQQWTEADNARLQREQAQLGGETQQQGMKPEERQAALEFIKANPNDPRTPAIKAALGM
jgi:hypothetical protein